MITLPPIPDITDPLGRGWRQPKKESIKIMMGHAWMDEETRKELPAYDASTPTALYAGKMWRSNGMFRYVTDDEEPGYVKIHSVPIMINK